MEGIVLLSKQIRTEKVVSKIVEDIVQKEMTEERMEL